MVILYKGNPANDKLNTLRVKTFLNKVASSTSSHVEPRCLPPTEDACSFHSLRVYLQVQEWKGISNVQPTEYGWALAKDRTSFIPVKTSLPIAPEYLLKLIRCLCKTGCKSNSCTCRKLGIKCSRLCKNCDLDCQNQPQLEIEFMLDE